MLAGDLTISNITKVYEDEAERIFFRICFCSTIVYVRSLMPAFMSMLVSHILLHFFVLAFAYLHYKSTSISYGGTKTNSKENSFSALSS